MSAMLDSLCGRERLADCIANDTAMGLISAPAVEFDELFFRRVDGSEPSAQTKAARNDARAVALESRMQAVADVVGRH